MYAREEDESNMDRRPVASTVLAEVGYDRRRKVLEVQFRTGRVYHYLAVPPAAHTALLAADSIGRYFNEEIKPRYRAVRGTFGGAR